jgi:hypothetical protein
MNKNNFFIVIILVLFGFIDPIYSDVQCGNINQRFTILPNEGHYCFDSTAINTTPPSIVLSDEFKKEVTSDFTIGRQTYLSSGGWTKYAVLLYDRSETQLLTTPIGSAQIICKNSPSSVCGTGDSKSGVHDAALRITKVKGSFELTYHNFKITASDKGSGSVDLSKRYKITADFKKFIRLDSNNNPLFTLEGVYNTDRGYSYMEERYVLSPDFYAYYDAFKLSITGSNTVLSGVLQSSNRDDEFITTNLTNSKNEAVAVLKYCRKEGKAKNVDTIKVFIKTLKKYSYNGKDIASGTWIHSGKKSKNNQDPFCDDSKNTWVDY